MKNGNVNKSKIAKMESQMKHAEFSNSLRLDDFIQIPVIFVA